MSDLASKALIPLAVRHEPKIYPSCPAESKIELDKSNPSVSRNFHKNQGED
jgi:hypothetical protein